jgi:heptaprenylglyceryl phosphate synthase
VYNQKLLIHNKCAWVGIHQAFYLLNYLSEINFDSRRIVFFYTLLNNKNTQFIVNKQYCTKKKYVMMGEV